MKRLHSFLPSSFLFLLSFLSISCAVQQGPQGGPIDTEPPSIIFTAPAEYSTNVRDKRILLEFSKYVDQRTVEESIFVSPYVGELEFDWSGKEVEITFTDPLRNNTTYVITAGTDIRDLHNSNRMAQAFTLAFSSGATIDRGAIEGRVYTMKPEDKPEGVMIFAYAIDGINADTLNPGTIKPDYITQTGTNGTFSLRHLSFGSYRIVAVRDEYRNLLYDREVDEFAVPSIALKLTASDTLTRGVYMKLSKEDTTAPRLIKLEAKNANHLFAEFSEPLDTSSVVSSHWSIADTLTRNSLPILSLYPNLPNLTSFTVVTARQDSQHSYRLTVEGVADLAGNRINKTANTLNVAGSGAKDTVGLKIGSISVNDSTRGVELLPSIRIIFSDAVNRTKTNEAIRFEESMGKRIESTQRWLSDEALVVTPQKRLQSKTWYRLTLAMRQVEDLSSIPSRDSTKTFRLETLDEETLSSIEGTVEDPRSADAGGRIVVTASNVADRNSRPYIAIASTTGTFIFPEILEGRYVLQAYRDQNMNGRFDFGLPFPFAPAERLSALTDTLKVRARWPLEGVRIELRGERK